MATNFLIIPRLTPPGSGTVTVQYRPNVPYQVPMVDYTDGTRVLQGSLVRFTVQTRTGFTLDSWKALYYDDYGDPVEIPLTPITGYPTWEFTMPSADVGIVCEARSTGTGDEYPPEFQNSGAFTITGYADLTTAFSALADKAGFGEVTSVTFSPQLPVIPDGVFFIAQLGAATTEYPYPASVRISNYSVDGNVTLGVGTGQWTNYNYSHYEITNGVLSLSGNYNVTSGTSILFAGYQVITGSGWTARLMSSVIGYPPGGQEINSIDYILNPESSGEVDQSSPTIFEEGTTEFTFNWRIKTGYSLRRITPFAVGEGSLEDDVLYSSDYDGETRTYTVTVQQIPAWAKGVRVLIECTNHNDPNVGGNSGVGGGNGTFDETSDHIPIEPMPSISAADAGLITLFRPSLSELKDLGAYLWTNIEDFIVNLQKMFSNPMDTIIALNILPGIPPVGTPRNIRLGLWETTISMPPVLSQWYEIDFGSVNVSEFWGSALDYSPNTKIHAMLPFIGSVQLNTDDVMGTAVGLVYRIDLLSGHLVAMLTVNDEVLYQFTGECAVAVPLTGADWSRVYGAIAGTIGAVAIGAAGAAAAGTATAGLSQTAASAQHVATQADFEYMSAAISGAGQIQLRALDSSARQLNAAAMNAVGRRNAAEAAKLAGAVALGSNTVNQIMGAKFQIAHSGTISGSAGLLGVRRPYIYIEYPNQSLPENYKHFYGYPSNMYASLGSLSGFTQCYQVLLTGVNGTDGEIAEILELLKEGVYL